MKKCKNCVFKASRGLCAPLRASRGVRKTKIVGLWLLWRPKWDHFGRSASSRSLSTELQKGSWRRNSWKPDFFRMSLTKSLLLEVHGTLKVRCNPSEPLLWEKALWHLRLIRKIKDNGHQIMRSLKNLVFYSILGANHGSGVHLETPIGLSFWGSRRSGNSLRRPLTRFSNLTCNKDWFLKDV